MKTKFPAMPVKAVKPLQSVSEIVTIFMREYLSASQAIGMPTAV